MKDKRIVPSKSSVTSILVEGKPHHFFHSEALGKCRAIIIIAEDENLPAHCDICGEISNNLKDWLCEDCQEANQPQKPTHCWHCGYHGVVRDKGSWHCGECEKYLGEAD